MKIHVQLNYGLDADEYAKSYAAGLVPDLAPYGFHHARKLESTVTFSDDRKRGGIWNIFRRIIRRSLGIDLLHAWHNRRKILAADIVWTMIESDYLAVSALLLIYRKDSPAVIGNNVWLFEKFPYFGFLRQNFYQALIKKTTVLTVHSQSYLALARHYFPKAHVHLLHFGISDSTFLRPNVHSIKHDGAIRVLAAGNDYARDWLTFISAFGGDPRFDVTIVSDQVSDEMVASFSNIRLPRRPTMEAFKELYVWADFVVLPMIHNKYSGITVAMEAVAMGRCVLSSKTGGVPTYFNEGEVLFCEVGNSKNMREVILSCNAEERDAIADRGHQRLIRDGYSTEKMIFRYYELSCNLLGLKPANAERSVPHV